MRINNLAIVLAVVMATGSADVYAQSHYSTSQAQENFNLGVKIERHAEANETTSGLEDAARAYQRALDADPDMVQAYIRLGYVLYALNRSDEGIQVLKSGLLRHPDNLELQHYLGLNLYQAGNVDEAEAILTDVTMKRTDQMPEAYFVLGKIHLERGDTAKAAEYFEKYTEEAPNDMRSWQALSSAYIQLRNIDASEAALNRLLELSPEDPIALINMGHVQYEKGQPDEAIQYYERALKADPGRDDLLYTIASVYYLNAQYEKAIEQFERLLQKKKSHMSAQYFIADSELKLNRLDDAENHFKALQAKMPDYKYLSLKLAYIHLLQGKKNALPEVKKLLKSSTNPDELHFGAVILRKSGDKKSSISAHEKLYKDHENDPVYALYLAREYLESKRYTEAIDLLNETAKRHKDPLTIEMMSFVLLQKGANDLVQGNLSDAKKSFEQAQGLNIHPAEAICNLSQVLILENKRDDAWRLFQKAESQSPDTPSVIKMSAQFDIFDSRYDSAINRLSRLKDSPGLDGSGWYMMAIAQSHLGQWDEAAKSLTEARKRGISDSPATAVIVIQNALQAFENNDYARAEKALAVAAKYKDQMNPADKVRYDYLSAVSHLRNRKFSQAKASLESTRTGFNKLPDSEKRQVTESGSLNLSFELAYVQYELNNYDAALALLSGMNTAESKSLEAAVRRKLAFTALKNHKYDQAQDHYNKLTALSSANPTDQYNQFVTQLLANKVSNPADKLEKFVKQNMPESLLNYAIYLDNAGNNDEAIKYYRKYVEQNNGSHIEEVRQMLTSKARVWGP